MRSTRAGRLGPMVTAVPAVSAALVALAALAPASAGAQRKDPRVRVVFYGGPESGGYQGDGEDALRRAGYDQTTPVECYITCGGGRTSPSSNGSGTETFMLSVTARVWRRATVDLLVSDGVGTDTRGYRGPGDEQVINVHQGTVLAVIGGAPLWRFRLGAGPAMYATPAGGSAGTTVASTDERVMRPGGVLDARFDLLRLGPVVAEVRGQLRAFAPITVTTGRGARYELGYRSLVLAAGVGLQR